MNSLNLNYMETSDGSIIFSKKKGVGYIGLNHPPANAYDIDIMQTLTKVVDMANKDDEVKVVVVKSKLEKFFSAGANIKTFGANDTEANKDMVVLARNMVSQIENSPKIYVAAIDGHALGGGLELAMACDLRFASMGAYALGLPEIKLGLIPGNGGTQRLIRIIGKSKALELLLTGDSISPQEAFDLLLINKLFPKESFTAQTEAWSEKLASGPSLAIEAIKRAVNEGMGMDLESGLELEKQLVDPLYDTADAQEGYRAFVEKRLPNFEGK